MSSRSKLRWSTGLYYPVVIFSSYIFAILEVVVRKEMMARTIWQGDRAYFAFSMNRSLVNPEDPRDVSHLVVDREGSMTVFIAEKDFREYVNKFSFNQVCFSMSAVFARFFDYYRQGLENRIIMELKTARSPGLPPFNEP